MKILHVCAIIVGTSLGCAVALLQPATGPGTGYSCGIHGKSCAEHLCCNEDEECGGPLNHSFSCPVGLCCYLGPEPGFIGMASHERKQRSPEQMR